MHWFYEISGQQFGPVDEGELDRLLAQGRMKPGSLVWREGMDDWAPLGQARPIPPPVIPPEIVHEPITERADEAPVAVERPGPPWERQRELGFIPALVTTVAGVLGSPSQTFSTMRRTGGYAMPLVYCLLLGTFGYMVPYLFAASRPLPTAAAAEIPPKVLEMMNFMRSSAGIRQVLIMLPFTILLTVTSHAGILHACLALFGAARKGFQTTFRVYTYTFGSAAMLLFIPNIGPFLGLIWGFVAGAIGLARAHESTPVRTISAAFVSFLLLLAGMLFMVASSGVMG